MDAGPRDIALASPLYLDICGLVQELRHPLNVGVFHGPTTTTRLPSRTRSTSRDMALVSFVFPCILHKANSSLCYMHDAA